MASNNGLQLFPALTLALCLLLVHSSHGQSTSFVDQDSKVSKFAEPGWFKDNIPFIEVPNKEIEDVYYYRWSSHKRHLRYSVPGAGYSVTEFVHKVGYSQKFDTINAAAGHHIYESRWLRNRRYVQDYINFWTKEGGGNQQYSEWVADASYKTFLVDGDADFIKSQQAGFVNNFNGWYDRFEPTLNLFFITPHDDAQEQSASSIQTDDPYHGGLGYRPSFNSEMYGNAIAIAKIARMNGDSAVAEDFEARAAALRQAVMDTLWDDERGFFYHMQREKNPNNELLDTREEVGFFPWYFGVPSQDIKYAQTWEHLFDAEGGFNTSYGPSTAEQRSQWYDGDQIATCCWWNGNSWPYSTGFTLGSLAAQVRNYFTTSLANPETYVGLLHKYALTQYKNGVPYVAECHSPGGDWWVGDSFNHSEHYAHSTYTDNVLADLIGIIPQPDDFFVVDPIVSAYWTYFIAENVPYHGHNVTVIYDADGTKYQTGHIGLQIFINGEFVIAQPKVGRLRVPIPPPIIQEHDGKRVKLENYAANVNVKDYPRPDASFTTPTASTWHAVDGRIFYDYVPNNRWSNFGSGNNADWFSVHFGPGRAKTISQVKLYVYSDAVTGEGGVDCPKAMTVEVLNGEAWEPALNQVSYPPTCSPNDVNVINFSPVRTEGVRVQFTRDVENDYYVGITELEVWAPFPQTSLSSEYEAEDGYINGAFLNSSTVASSGSYVVLLGQDESSVEFTGIWAEDAGVYEVEVYYASGWDDGASMTAVTNNLESQVVEFPRTPQGWGYFDDDNLVRFSTVDFVKGNNNIIFKNREQFVELDRIRVAKV